MFWDLSELLDVSVGDAYACSTTSITLEGSVVLLIKDAVWPSETKTSQEECFFNSKHVFKTATMQNDGQVVKSIIYNLWHELNKKAASHRSVQKHWRITQQK